AAAVKRRAPDRSILPAPPPIPHRDATSSRPTTESANLVPGPVDKSHQKRISRYTEILLCRKAGPVVHRTNRPGRQALGRFSARTRRAIGWDRSAPGSIGNGDAATAANAPAWCQRRPRETANRK